MPVDGPKQFAFSPEECSENKLTVGEKFILEEFEKDKLLMHYVRLKDEGTKVQMEKTDPFLKVHAEEYRMLKAKAEKSLEQK